MTAQRLQDIIELYRFDEANGTYTGTCTLLYSNNVVEVIGLATGITRDNWRELMTHCREQGVTELIWDRKKGDKTLRKSVKP